MSISPLPEDVRAQIKSSVEITSLLDVVDGLLRNALDAGAGSVSITVDFARGFCAVEDNGTGIPSFEFSQRGHLAQIHCESSLNRHLKPSIRITNSALGGTPIHL